MKRAQVTIFIILAIIIVLVIFIFWSYQKKILFFASETNEAKMYIQDCIENSLMEGIFFNAAQGGYFLAPKDSIAYEFISIPVYYDKGVINVPDLNELENQLGLAVKLGVENCVKDFTESNQEYQVNFEEVTSVEVQISENKITADLVMPIFITKADTTKEYKDFSAEVNFNLIEKYDIITQAIEFQKSFPDNIPITQLTELAYENDFYFTVTNSEPVFIYSFQFSDKKDQYHELNYTYLFATIYNE